MPSFKGVLTDTELWQVAQLVAHANEIPDSVKKILAAAQDPATAAPAPTKPPAYNK